MAIGNGVGRGGVSGGGAGPIHRAAVAVEVAVDARNGVTLARNKDAVVDVFFPPIGSTDGRWRVKLAGQSAAPVRSDASQRHSAQRERRRPNRPAFRSDSFYGR